MLALVEIAKGSNLHRSYQGQRSTSSDVVLRYGFVEAWPQRSWSWMHDERTMRIAASYAATTTTADEQEHSTATLAPFQHRIIVVSSRSVAIYPLESMTTWIGSDTMMPPTLEE